MKRVAREPGDRENPRKDAPEHKTMDELRKPSTILPSHPDGFRIVSPGPHEPAGQTTHG